MAAAAARPIAWHWRGRAPVEGRLCEHPRAWVEGPRGAMENESGTGDAHALEHCNALLRLEFERVKKFLSDPSIVPQPAKAAS